MRTIFKGGKVVDGSGAPSYVADILVENGVIAGIGSFEGEPGTQVYDARERIVCPGFIDTHTHSDLAAIVNPALSAKIRQGITTELLGQDGVALAPLPEQYITAWRKNIAGLDGDTDLIDWKYRDTDGYLSLLAAYRPATNLSYLVPHGNVRMEAMGLDGRAATK